MLLNAIRLKNINTDTEKWIDPEITRLEREIQVILDQIDKLEEESTDVDNIIHKFEVRRTQELGEIILRILNLKRCIAEKKVKQHPENLETQHEFKQARTNEEEYMGTYRKTIDEPQNNLNEQQQKELKTMYRKIAKLLHGDLGKIEDNFKKQAEELLIKANDANANNDLKAIREIFEYLENGIPFIDKNNTKPDVLIAKSKHLKYIKYQIAQKLFTKKTSETYRTIIQITNWDLFFVDAKSKLNTELKNLENLSCV